MTSQEFNRAMGAAIKRLRRARGLKQADIGGALGVSYQQAQKFETGANGLSAFQMTKLSVVLCVSISALYKEAGTIQLEPLSTAAENDSFLAARYIAKIRSPQQRSALIDYTRKLAYEGASV